MNKISIATNVTEQDSSRILNVLPNWIKVFGYNIEEILIVYDRKPIEGRIRDLHITSKMNTSLEFNSDNILRIDNRIKIIDLEYEESDVILNKWFRGKAKPMRCQAGTPIYAFVFAIEKSALDLVLKVDCDMVFYNNGFVEEIFKQFASNEFEIMQISKSGPDTINNFSTRAFFINRPLFNNILPIKAYKLDFLRSIHRKMHNRSTYIALEQMIQKELEKNNIKRFVLPPELGYSMHIARLDEMELDEISKIINYFGDGIIPDEQLKGSENFSMKFWLNLSIINNL